MTFPIIGWASLPEELTRPATFAAIRDSGVNVFMTCNGPEQVTLRQLDLAAEYGIKALVQDERFRPSSKPDWRSQAVAALKTYRDHPSVFGWFVRDEPARSEFESEAGMVALLRAESPDKVTYVNGFGFGPKGAESFFEYVEDYARIIKPAFLSFDCYPIAHIPPDASESDLYRRDRGVEWAELKAYYREVYWEAWETYRLVGWKYNLPLWGFVLATPHKHSIWNYGPVTEGTVRLEAFTGLAHGVQAIQYFTLPFVPNEGWFNGILAPDGTASERHDIFQRVNRDLSVLGLVISGLQCTGVFHTGPLTSYCRRFTATRGGRDTSHYPIARLNGDPSIVGFLRDADARYAMIVNRNPARKAMIEIELSPGYEACEVSKTTGTTCPPIAGAWQMGLEPGDGTLLKLQRQGR